jgi:hypothetical protein
VEVGVMATDGWCHGHRWQRCSVVGWWLPLGGILMSWDQRKEQKRSIWKKPSATVRTCVVLWLHSLFPLCIVCWKIVVGTLKALACELVAAKEWWSVMRWTQKFHFLF